MIEFTLTFDKKNEIFRGTFKELPKEFIGALKEQWFLERVTDEFIESLPDTFDGEIDIDEVANSEDTYWLFFYTEVKATDEIKMPIKKYQNRDININEDDDSLEFSIFIPKKSGIVKKADSKEIILSFF